MSVDYTGRETPTEYVCRGCRMWTCKLWRLFVKGSNCLLCLNCSAELFNVDVSAIDSNGQLRNQKGEPLDMIGWNVPAVPLATPLATIYFQPSAIPADALAWWQGLPNQSPKRRE